MTSNIGADVLKNQTSLGFKKVTMYGSYQAMKDLLSKEIEKHFRPEFLNRLDDTIVFHPLTREDLQHIIHLEMKGVEARIAKKGVAISLSKEALEYLIDQGYNPDYGARPLKRAIERLVEDPMSEGLLRGEFKDVKEIHITLKDNHLFFEPVQSEKKEVTAAGGEAKK
jgi:ATP-dependent Clp protease ATP-binding subunit ClpC